MKCRVKIYVLLVWSLLVPLTTMAQDFILQGCYWQCPGAESIEIDSSNLQFWTNRIKGQAPELGYEGFTYFFLPGIFHTPEASFKEMARQLDLNGVKIIADVWLDQYNENQDSTYNTDLTAVEYLHHQTGISNFKLSSKDELNANQCADLISQLNQLMPGTPLIGATHTIEASTQDLAGWWQEVNQLLSEEVHQETDIRIYDHSLREELRIACTDDTYDVRNIYQSGLRDGTGFSGFNLISMVNAPEYRNQNTIEGDFDDLNTDPLLAYAYILTNNQVGLPAVFYADYYGELSESESHLGKAPLQEDINQLLSAHRKYIHQSTSVEYLNAHNSERKNLVLSAGDADAVSKVLIYQLDGKNTPASEDGQIRDVLVAINFSDSPVNLIQEINMANVGPDDIFTDILGRSNTPRSSIKEQADIPNSVFLNIPARNYSIWVKGKATQIVSALIDLEVNAYEDFVEINWEVPEERGIQAYEIQRSINGEAFETIAELESLASWNESAAYLFADESLPYNTDLYYRIKLISEDDKFEYSPVEKTKIVKEQVDIEFVTDESGIYHAIRFSSNYEDQGKLILFNSEGHQVWAELYQIEKGRYTKEINLNELPVGVYFAQFSTNKEKEWNKRLVKL